MKQAIIIALIVLSIVPAAAAAAEVTTTAPNGTATTAPDDGAATATPTPTASSTNASAPPGAPSEVELVIDEDLVLVDHGTVNGQLQLRFWSTAYKAVSIAPAVDSDDSAGTLEFRAEVVDKDKETLVRVPDTGGVTMWTEASIAQNRFHYVKTGSGSLISGPYSGSDVQTAGLFGALGVSIAVLYQAIAAKLGASEPARRVA